MCIGLLLFIVCHVMFSLLGPTARDIPHMLRWRYKGSPWSKTGQTEDHLGRGKWRFWPASVGPCASCKIPKCHASAPIVWRNVGDVK